MKAPGGRGNLPPRPFTVSGLRRPVAGSRREESAPAPPMFTVPGLAGTGPAAAVKDASAARCPAAAVKDRR